MLTLKILSKTNIYKDKSSPIKYVSEEELGIKNVGENIKREVDKSLHINLNSVQTPQN